MTAKDLTNVHLKFTITSFTICAFFMYLIAVAIELHDGFGVQKSENLGYGGARLEVGALIDEEVYPIAWNKALVTLCEREGVSFTFQKQRNVGILAVHDPEQRFSAIKRSGSAEKLDRDDIAASWAAAQANESYSAEEIINSVLPGFKGQIYDSIPAQYLMAGEQVMVYASPDVYTPAAGIYYFASERLLETGFAEDFLTQLNAFGADFIHVDVYPGRDTPVERAKHWWTGLGRIAQIAFALAVVCSVASVLHWYVKGMQVRLRLVAMYGGSQRDLRAMIMKSLIKPAVTGLLLSVLFALVVLLPLRSYEMNNIGLSLLIAGCGVVVGLVFIMMVAVFLAGIFSRRASRVFPV